MERTKRKLVEVPDDLSNLMYRRLSDGKVEMAVHTVMYGLRIRAGYVGEQFVEWDWCCGDNRIVLEMTYGIVRNFLNWGVEFKELPPNSRVKPWNKDEWFMEIIDTKMKEFDAGIQIIELLKVMDLYQPIKTEDYEGK